jgi:hypothetical protein
MTLCKSLRSLAFLLCFAPATALAGGLDLHLEGLVDKSKQTSGAAATGNYKSLMTELGLAFGPRNLGPAASLGSLGIEFAYEYGMASVNGGADYWTKTVDDPRSVLTTHGIHVRKGLPYSMQLDTSLTILPDSNLTGIGAGLNIAAIDGFKSIPDLALNFGVNAVLGFPSNATVDMLVAWGGGTLSKSFGIAGILSLQPWVGGMGTFTYANTHQTLTAAHAGQLSGDEFGFAGTVKAWSGRFTAGLRLVAARTQVGFEFQRQYPNDLNVLTTKFGAAF